MRLELLIQENGAPEKRASLHVEGKRWLIGRGQATLALTDHRCSRHHALLYLDGNRLRLKDLGSQNGTRLNSQKIADSAIEAGDKIRIGQTLIVLLGYRWQPESSTKLFPLRETPLCDPSPAVKPSVVRHWPDLYHCRPDAQGA